MRRCSAGHDEPEYVVEVFDCVQQKKEEAAGDWGGVGTAQTRSSPSIPCTKIHPKVFRWGTREREERNDRMGEMGISHRVGIGDLL
jgi:hypothetical protein